jgi:hypothetical protein
VIKNQEFIAMRAAEKVWPALSTTEDQLRELVSDGLIQDQDLADWKTPGEHRVPFPGPSEIVLFVSFIRAGLCLSASPFLHQLLRYFDISLNHLTLNVAFIFLCLFTFVSHPPLHLLVSLLVDKTWSAVYRRVCPR